MSNRPLRVSRPRAEEPKAPRHERNPTGVKSGAAEVQVRGCASPDPQGLSLKLAEETAGMRFSLDP
jgi:hypothetical protein